MLPSLMSSQSLVRKRYPTVTDHGSTVVDYKVAPVSTLPFTGSVQPGTGAEDLSNRDGAEALFKVYSPLTDVQYRDLVDYAGKTYLVDGEPERWETGVLDHMVINLSRWSG